MTFADTLDTTIELTCRTARPPVTASHRFTHFTFKTQILVPSLSSNTTAVEEVEAAFPVPSLVSVSVPVGFKVRSF